MQSAIRAEWLGASLRWTVAGFVYLLASGLVILLASFSTGAQISVLVHTLAGIAWLVPFIWYFVPHLARRWREPFSHLVLLGWLTGVLFVGTAISGVVLTWQAALGTRIDAVWDLVHTIAGCAAAPILVAHLITAVRRGKEGEWGFVRRLLSTSTVGGCLAAAVTFGGGVLIDLQPTRKALPENYSLRYGANPFAPSQARTDWLWRLDEDQRWIDFLKDLEQRPDEEVVAQVASFLEGVEARHADSAACLARGETHPDELGGFEADSARITELRQAGVDREAFASLRVRVEKERESAAAQFEKSGGFEPDALAGSETCGTTGCHEEIYEEWAPSAHRYASRSTFFQAIQGAMAEANGAESTRYCAGCHDPISLFSGSKNIFHDDLSSPGADEGISCAVCHSIVRTDVEGNANYVLSPPRRYLAEDSFIGKFLIRAYPREHKVQYARPMLKTPEFCGACHKQFIDEELNRSTRVQLQNQYDAWKGSHWFVPDKNNPDRADPEKSLVCNDCHMREMPTNDPSAVVDGKHKHHGFIASNQWLPLHHELPGAAKHVRLTEEWLQGKTVIPEIADKWPGGPPVPIRVEAPATVKAGESVRITVIADNRKVGHTFPTGPLDVIQCWMDVKVTVDGKEIFRSGRLDDAGFIESGSWMFKAEGVDRAGNLIDRHNLWDMVGARFRRVLFPGYSDRQNYDVVWDCEGSSKIKGDKVEFTAPATGELFVEAVLKYRKVDQTLLNVIWPDGKMRSPVTDMSRATARIRVVGSGQ
jgi:hypothetical protein